MADKLKMHIWSTTPAISENIKLLQDKINELIDEIDAMKRVGAKADGTSEKDLRVFEVIDSACECLQEWRKTKIEENAFPYGDNLSFDECEKCGHKWNIHVV